MNHRGSESNPATWALSLLDALLECCHSWSSSPAPAARVIAEQAKKDQLNDSVHLLHVPEPERHIEVDLVFFHGLNLGDARSARSIEWLSGDDAECCWPQKWLPRDLKKAARILAVSYDTSVQKTDISGRVDLDLIVENLVDDLILSESVGIALLNRPLILVGHSVGGLVIKKLCLRAATELLSSSTSTNESEHNKLQNFLSNLRGVFYFSTPHTGSCQVRELLRGSKKPSRGRILESIEQFNEEAGRLDPQFVALREKYNNTWKRAGVGELHETHLEGGSFLVVEDASARSGVDYGYFRSLQEDHFSVCRPKGRNASSYQYLTKFVDRILKEAVLPAHILMGLPVHRTASLVQRALEVQEKLSSGARILGIVGMGGIGKTTLAKQVFNNMSSQFEYTCFADNVKGLKDRTSDGRWLLKDFYRNGMHVEGTTWSHVKNCKVLIVLDDVDAEEQFSGLPMLDFFGDGSSLVITLRDESVLSFYNEFTSYNVDFLELDEAKKLFCLHVFSKEEIPEHVRTGKNNLEEYVQRVVAKCDGLPLTLEVTGRSLRPHLTDAIVWAQTIDKLSKAESIGGDANDKIWAKLSVSYDKLALKERGMLLDAATYFFDYQLQDALAAWSTTYGNSETRWMNLVGKSLVKEVRAYDWRFHTECKIVWVHEHLRDLAWSIRAPGNLHIGTGLEDSNEIIDLLNANQVNADEIEILHLHGPERHVVYGTVGSRRLLKLHPLAKLKQLKYLHLENVGHPLNFLREYISDFPSKLSLLIWKVGFMECYNLPIKINEMNSLAVLKLHNWNTTNDFPEALEKLEHLRILVLSDLRGFTRLSTKFGELSQVERLELNDLRLSELPESFGNLSSLSELVIEGCRLLKSLPQSFGDLSRLEILRIDGCGMLESLPEKFCTHLSSLKILIILKCRLLRCLPHSLSQVSSLQKLYVRDCAKFERLFPTSTHSMENLRGLQELDLYHLDALHSLPARFGPLKSLLSLRIEACEPIRLPTELGQLTSVTDLHLDFNGDLPSGGTDLGELLSLTDLYLDYNGELPASVGNLSCLRRLFFHNTHGEEEKLSLQGWVDRLPDSLWNLSRSLHKLELGPFCNLELRLERRIFHPHSSILAQKSIG